ncbi:SitA6 family polymorphic toxin lipoprotein [Hyalangium gracile]|uniref:SitA6 family polymorphic toxin lipoprotein n=1 Tax=Hyalangium gracile TaxID=394092 RepID=UPI001CCEA4FD|nr:TIGR02269 family lipoprotein [Hyalangium gracile]
MRVPLPPLILICLSALLLSACGTTSPSTRAWEHAARDAPSACEEPGADQCIVFACDGEDGVCGIFSCEDVDLEAVASASLAYGAEWALGGAYRPPLRGPVPFRNWRNMGVREGARPRMMFHFRYRFGYLPAFPRYEGRVVRHHLFPQAPEFREWFARSGIDIHQYTMLIPEHVHRQIHGGVGRGGLWNEAWRAYREANPNRQHPDALLRHALELAFRYELIGPIVPYNRPVRPIGPQLYQN